MQNSEDLDPERRQTFRYTFKNGLGLKIRFNGKNLMILDISPGGLKFKNRGFIQYESGPILVDLEIPGFIDHRTFMADLRILQIDENDICHCYFENCSLAHHERIHNFVLEMQQLDLLKKKDDLSS